MNVCAIIVTRGDQDLTPILDSLPLEWERIVWNNGMKAAWIDAGGDDHRWVDGSDLSVYGRYAAIEHTAAELIYVQDDDCLVSDPLAIVNAWEYVALELGEIDRTGTRGHVVCNMPQEFRHEFYEEHALVGFGAAFHRDAPDLAFTRFGLSSHSAGSVAWGAGVDQGFFDRTCDIVFTALTPRVLVDVPKEDMPWAHYETRLWKQPGHQAERTRMLDLVRQITVESASQR